MSVLFEYLAGHAGIIALFLLIGLGMSLGSVKFKGVGLGAAAVLFTAIILSAWANHYGVELRVDKTVGHLGLAIFTFAIGINSGPNFFSTLKRSLGPLTGLLVVMMLGGAVAYVVGVHVMGMDIALVAGTYAGAITNTPALAAASASSGNEALATVGYSISYLYGVIGAIIVSAMALSYGKFDKDVPSPLSNRTVRVERDDMPVIGDLSMKLGGKVTFSRLRRGETGPIMRPTADDVLHRDDLVTVVGPSELVKRIVMELGHGSSHSLVEDRTHLDIRRITVSNPALAGLTIDKLDMGRRFSATISRVRRGDIDMVGEPGLVLQQGDRVRVVAPARKIKEISKYFGDSSRGMYDINPVALGLGMAVGIMLGNIPIPMPGGNTFSIGAAAGTLIMGLIFGRVGRVGKFVTALPFTACQVLAELGLLMFLAQAGTNAGGQIAKAFTGGTWIQILILGAVVTTVVTWGLYFVMRYVFHLGGTRLAGLIGGAQTQPAVLGFANARTNADARVALGYAMVYPMAMVLKILVAQVLGGL